jgi:hypothetical protein
LWFKDVIRASECDDNGGRIIGDLMTTVEIDSETSYIPLINKLEVVVEFRAISPTIISSSIVGII